MTTDDNDRDAAKSWTGIGVADRRIAETLYQQLKSDGAIPSPWSMSKFITACEQISGQRIVLCPQPPDFWQSPEPGECVTGMLLTLPGQHLILYRENSPGRYQDHQIAHELAHLLFEHDGAGNISDRQLEALFGDLFTDTEAVRNALTHNRIGLDNAQERQAEALADLLLSGEAPLTPDTERARRLFGLR